MQFIVLRKKGKTFEMQGYNFWIQAVYGTIEEASKINILAALAAHVRFKIWSLTRQYWGPLSHDMVH